MAGLKVALEMIHEEGLPKVLARHLRLSKALRAGCAALGLAGYGEEGALSPTVVALQVPEKLNGGDIVKRLYEKHRTVIAGSRNKLSGRVIRIGTMGYLSEEDILTDLRHLEDVLPELGFAVTAGTGLRSPVRLVLRRIGETQRALLSDPCPKRLMSIGRIGSRCTRYGVCGQLLSESRFGAAANGVVHGIDAVVMPKDTHLLAAAA